MDIGISPGLMALVGMIGGALFLGELFNRAYTDAVEDTRRKAVDRNTKELDMTGFVFTEGSLRYEVDRSIMIIEKYDEWKTEPRYISSMDYSWSVTRLFYDTVLEHVFMIKWTKNRYERTVTKNHHVFQSRDDLVAFCQDEFPDILREIIETEFNYPSFNPTDDEILRSRYGTNNYIPFVKEQEEPVTV